VINEYNHYIKGVDYANQLRAATIIYRPREHRIWIPLWQFYFEVSIVNISAEASERALRTDYIASLLRN